jgi:hypothetical protein
MILKSHTLLKVSLAISLPTIITTIQMIKKWRGFFTCSAPSCITPCVLTTRADSISWNSCSKSLNRRAHQIKLLPPRLLKLLRCCKLQSSKTLAHWCSLRNHKWRLKGWLNVWATEWTTQTRFTQLKLKTHSWIALFACTTLLRAKKPRKRWRFSTLNLGKHY